MISMWHRVEYCLLTRDVSISRTPSIAIATIAHDARHHPVIPPHSNNNSITVLQRSDLWQSVHVLLSPGSWPIPNSLGPTLFRRDASAECAAHIRLVRLPGPKRHRVPKYRCAVTQDGIQRSVRFPPDSFPFVSPPVAPAMEVVTTVSRKPLQKVRVDESESHRRLQHSHLLLPRNPDPDLHSPDRLARRPRSRHFYSHGLPIYQPGWHSRRQ